MGALILLIVLLYPAAFIGGFIVGKIGVSFRPFRAAIYIAVCACLAMVTVPAVQG
jgi:hypothetical protein